VLHALRSDYYRMSLRQRLAQGRLTDTIAGQPSSADRLGDRREADQAAQTVTPEEISCNILATYESPVEASDNRPVP